MHLYADEVRRGIRLRHVYEAVAHAKANLYNATCGLTELRIPIQHPVFNRQAKGGKALIPATLLTWRHATGPHHKTTDARTYWGICQAHGRYKK